VARAAGDSSCHAVSFYSRWPLRWAGQRACDRGILPAVLSVALLGTPPAALYYWWLVAELEAPLPDRIPFAISGTWLVLGPVLLLIGERAFARSFTAIDREPTKWDLDAIHRALASTARWYWPVELFAVAVGLGAYLLGRHGISGELQLGAPPSLRFVAGAALITWVSLICGAGLWGVLHSVRAIHVATRSNTAWLPFRPRALQSVHHLSSLVLVLAASASASGVLLPAFWAVHPSLSRGGQALVLVASISIGLGGLTILVSTSIFLAQLARRAELS
jgi:hypothetical protein